LKEALSSFEGASRERRVVSDHHPQPLIVVTIVWGVVVAGRRPDVAVIIVEGTAPDDAAL
jgi:hypothetical protein